ncbi:hypothetical protein [Methylobacterium sp. WL7]|uniref:hypothetical protein n=1 Tax=Methylobacterium sp. WL7 TaxID=2603900 RepID=UPI00164F55B5|nr:hypothetical protein [Methylobacterium sp. WL7]
MSRGLGCNILGGAVTDRISGPRPTAESRRLPIERYAPRSIIEGVGSTNAHADMSAPAIPRFFIFWMSNQQCSMKFPQILVVYFEHNSSRTAINYAIYLINIKKTI